MKKPTDFIPFLLPLIAEVNDGHTEAQLRSGFVVAFEDIWVWVTAAHCAEDISAFCAEPHSRIAFACFVTPQKPRIDVVKTDWKPINLREKLRDVLESELVDHISEEDIENFDLAIWQIPPLTRLYLINAGYQPFQEHQFIPSDEHLLELIPSKEKWLFALGLPDVLINEVSPDSIVVQAIAVPLHPNPDENTNSYEPRELELQHPLAWIPTWFDDGQWQGDIRGVSGGPVLCVIENEPYLLGVATCQKPNPPRTPKFLGCTQAYAVLKFLSETIKS